MPPRKNRHAKAGKSKKKTLLWTLAIILLLIIGGLVYYFTAIYNQLDNLHKTGEDSPFANVPTASAEAVKPLYGKAQSRSISCSWAWMRAG